MPSPDCQHCLDAVCKHRDGRWVKFCPGAEADNTAFEERLQAQRGRATVVTRLRRNGRLVPLGVEELL